MSRSLHTDPRAIRAVRRLLAPRQPRSERRRGPPQAGEAGAQAGSDLSSIETRPSVPLRVRVTEAAARPGWLHAARRRDVVRFLRLLDPELLYGVREIALVRTQAHNGRPELVFGRFVSVGRIELFEQQVPPWFMRGRLPSAYARRLVQGSA